MATVKSALVHSSRWPTRRLLLTDDCFGIQHGRAQSQPVSGSATHLPTIFRIRTLFFAIDGTTSESQQWFAWAGVAGTWKWESTGQCRAHKASAARCGIVRARSGLDSVFVRLRRRVWTLEQPRPAQDGSARAGAIRHISRSVVSGQSTGAKESL